MKKLFLVLFVLAFMVAGGALARGWHNVTKSGSDFVSTEAQNRTVLWCDAYAGNGIFWAKVTTETETLGYMAAATGDWSKRLDLTEWNKFVLQSSGVATGYGGHECDEDCYVTVVSAETDAFWQCAYVDPN
jgi:hypothetical protein